MSAESTGLKLTCECGKVHLIRSFGKREGHWRCLPCGGSIHWKDGCEAEMLIPPQRKKKDDIMDIFGKR